MNGQTVWRRLVDYAKPFQKRIWLALVLLIISTAADLAGPFIAKVVIDNHIVSIQKQWYRFEQVPYQEEQQMAGIAIEGAYYVREDWLPNVVRPEVSAAVPVEIVILGTDYYLLDRVPGIENGKITPVYGYTDQQTGREHYQLNFVVSDRQDHVAAIRLTAADVKALYSRDVVPIILLLSGYAALILFAAGMNYIQLLSLQTTAQRIIQRMRLQLFSHIQKLSVSYFDSTPVGQLVSRLTNDTEAIRELYVSVLATFVQNGVYLLGILLALFILQPQLALFCLLLVPVLFFLVMGYRRYSSKYYATIRSRLSEMNGTINEMIQNMSVVQAFRREKQVEAEFAEVNDAYYHSRLKENNLESFLLRPAVDLLWKLSLTGILWYFGDRSLQGILSFGVLYAFIDYMGRFFEPINMIMDRLSALQQAVISSQRVFEILDTQTMKQTGKKELPRPQGEVVFDQVSFAYKDDEYVLKNVSFTAKPGQTVALVGHTGSGKSSMMNLLLGFYPVTKGRITIDGTDLSEIDPEALRRHVGLVLQDPFLFTGTVAFNIRLYNDWISDEDVLQAAKAVKADDFIRQLPKQYDEPVVERGATLSAGQRQLLSFARALASDPAILVLDEATASIDSETESAIQEALQVLSKGRTTFMIAHRLSTIQHADLILVLSRGEVVERGTHEELMRQQGIYQKMYQLQQGDHVAGELARNNA
ncbi:ABC transporter ATP-binding protein [Brevibacillus migulae]|uniref:ABC transporter ATP-binding protein n=1 Tax=Brevibacillus migulae TaxID=1644114 RepID=UPI00106EB9BD|nr:ABC transporter ATP-binding protein [Brevibacillus migulae]